MRNHFIVQGYHALTVAILAKCMPELAFEKLENPMRKHSPGECREVDICIWKRMRAKGVLYTEIAELYCLSAGAIAGHIDKMKKERISVKH